MPVDFVGQNHVSKHRTSAELKLAKLLVKDRATGDVGRQEIGSELHAAKLSADALGQRASKCSLTDPRDVLDKQVPFAKDGDDRHLHCLALTNNNLLNFPNDLRCALSR